MTPEQQATIGHALHVLGWLIIISGTGLVILLLDWLGRHIRRRAAEKIDRENREYEMNTSPWTIGGQDDSD